MKPYNYSHNTERGFTLIELLVVIAIIGLLSSVVLASLNSARTKTKDSERVQTLKAFETALELYYDDFGKYPNADMVVDFENFSYHKRTGTGPTGCNINDWYNQGIPANSLRLENSASPGFMPELFSGGYISVENWNDPNNPSSNSDIYNCRYLVPEVEALADNVQHYLLHCNLEANSRAEKNDGGLNDTVYEIMKPSPWVCICGDNGQTGPMVSPMAEDPDIPLGPCQTSQ